MQLQLMDQTRYVMGAEQIKEVLHLRIEQADEHFLRILHAMMEAYAAEHLQEDDEVAAYEASLKPMTVEELIARSRASDEDIAAGRVYDIDEVMREDLI
ncbi:MAG: hypothetical protein DHS20C18_30790 [Saprospiraceae bacterium]|nr:MAG: hypothetical protein DHS20C18_30790 [Saprospiraceae bacterium]